MKMILKLVARLTAIDFSAEIEAAFMDFANAQISQTSNSSPPCLTPTGRDSVDNDGLRTDEAHRSLIPADQPASCSKRMRDVTLKNIEQSPKNNIRTAVAVKSDGINPGTVKIKLFKDEHKAGRHNGTYYDHWMCKDYRAKPDKLYKEFVFGNVINFLFPESGTKIRLIKSPQGYCLASKYIREFKPACDIGFRDQDYKRIFLPKLFQSIIIGDIDFYVFGNFGLTGETFKNIDFDNAGRFTNIGRARIGNFFAYLRSVAFNGLPVDLRDKMIEILISQDFKAAIEDLKCSNEHFNNLMQVIVKADEKFRNTCKQEYSEELVTKVFFNIPIFENLHHNSHTLPQCIHKSIQNQIAYLQIWSSLIDLSSHMPQVKLESLVPTIRQSHLRDTKQQALTQCAADMIDRLTSIFCDFYQHHQTVLVNRTKSLAPPKHRAVCVTRAFTEKELRKTDATSLTGAGRFVGK